MFVPGKSGNPGGRPKKLDELKLKIVEMTSKHLARLEGIAADGENKDSISAIKLMWSYAYGNPAQAITGEDGSPLFPVVGDVTEMLKRLSGVPKSP